MKIFIYSTHPFLLQLASLPTHPPFNQLHLLLESKVKYMGVDITCFFQDLKSPLTNHKKCLMQASYGASETSKLKHLFTKQVNGS